jgi:hypothetical protein
MAKNTVSRAEVQAVAAELRKKVFGSQGVPEWGTKFSEIEDIACEIGDAISCEIMQQAVAEQARTPPASAGVCACGQATIKDPDEPAEPHPLQTSRGDIGWQEPKEYCPACRQAFFPSVPSVGAAAR